MTRCQNYLGRLTFWCHLWLEGICYSTMYWCVMLMESFDLSIGTGCKMLDLLVLSQVSWYMDIDFLFCKTIQGKFCILAVTFEHFVMVHYYMNCIWLWCWWKALMLQLAVCSSLGFIIMHWISHIVWKTTRGAHLLEKWPLTLKHFIVSNALIALHVICYVNRDLILFIKLMELHSCLYW